MDYDIILGLHSITEALKNPKRTCLRLMGTQKGLSSLGELKNKVQLETLSPHQLQGQGEELIRDSGFEYSRIPNGLILLARPLPVRKLGWLYEQEEQKLVAFDQLTDVHNLAAGCRTLGFFGLTKLLISQKNPLRISPGFYRISSGAREHIEMIQVSALSTALKKLKEKGLEVVGMDEMGQSELSQKSSDMACLVVGAEEMGLSHAVKRVCDLRKLSPSGPVGTLNVSVALGIGCERYFK